MQDFFTIYFFNNRRNFILPKTFSSFFLPVFIKNYKKAYTTGEFCAIIKNMKNQSNRASSRPSSAVAGAVAGRNAVSELIASGRPIEKIFFLKDGEGALRSLFARAKERGIPTSFADKTKLSALAGGQNHQGVVALAAEKEYATLDRLFEIAEERGEAPFLVIADGVEDPHNLGALIRCCDGAGVHGIIIPKAGAVGMTPTVYKSSAGAAEHMAVCRVSNLASTVELLKKKGVWVYACEADGAPYETLDYKGPIAIILGSEGFGVSRLLKEKSDFILSLPMRGKVNSLNVSCAAAVILYEAVKYR